MRLVARFMKPYWALCAVTTVLLLVDVVGALVIPTFAAELLNESATSASFKKMTITAVGMGVAALISGMCAVAGGRMVLLAVDLSRRQGHAHGSVPQIHGSVDL